MIIANNNFLVYLSTKATVKNCPKVKADGKHILVIEPDDYSEIHVRALKSRGYKILAYLSVGTISTDRTWWKTYNKYKLDRLEDWPKEYYMDLTKYQWRDFLYSRADELKKKGFDGFWCDNLDVYEEYPKEDMFKACKWALIQLHDRGYVMVNGGSAFFEKCMDLGENLSRYVDSVCQEEVYSLITDYDGSGKFGEQEKEQHDWYKKYMKRLKKHCAKPFFLEYTRDSKLVSRIKRFCAVNHIGGYCISNDVDL